MDQITLETEQISMEHIASGVQGLRIAFVNVFGVKHPDGSWTLIDAGVPFSESLIANWAEKHFGTPPNAIFLTHGHFDHVSCAKGLSEKWDVPVYAHPLEFPYLTGQLEYPAPNVAAGGGLMTLLSPLFPRSPIDLGTRLRPLTSLDGFEVTSDILPGWQILFTPGHTPGHVSLFRPEDRTLLPGDAFCTTKPESFFEAALAQQAELHGPPAYFTWDWAMAKKSVERLSKLNPAVVAPGHGKPLSGGDLPQALIQLAAHFDEIAVPENKK